jgi:hypothetical protein
MASAVKKAMERLEQHGGLRRLLARKEPRNPIGFIARQANRFSRVVIGLAFFCLQSFYRPDARLDPDNRFGRIADRPDLILIEYGGKALSRTAIQRGGGGRRL